MARCSWTAHALDFYCPWSEMRVQMLSRLSYVFSRISNPFFLWSRLNGRFQSRLRSLYNLWLDQKSDENSRMRMFWWEILMGNHVHARILIAFLVKQPSCASNLYCATSKWASRVQAQHPLYLAVFRLVVHKQVTRNGTCVHFGGDAITRIRLVGQPKVDRILQCHMREISHSIRM
jgi:hypothetical protein